MLLVQQQARVAVEEVEAVVEVEAGKKKLHLKLINFRSEQEILSSQLKCHLPNIILQLLINSTCWEESLRFFTLF